MTIILAIPAKDGLIIASDGQITSGGVRTAGRKIKGLNNKAIWAASGRDSAIQRVEEKIIALPNKEQPLQDLRDVLGRTIRQCIYDLYQLDQQPLGEDFIFGEFSNNTPMILHITPYGTPEWIRTGVYAIGIGRDFAHALLQNYRAIVPNKIDVNKGALLAFKVIEETIEVGSYGLGPPIDIWQITEGSVKNFSEEEIKCLEDLSQGLREAELKLFLSGTK